MGYAAHVFRGLRGTDLELLFVAAGSGLEALQC